VAQEGMEVQEEAAHMKKASPNNKVVLAFLSGPLLPAPPYVIVSSS